MSKLNKDQISVENIELNEYIKDYLKFNGFQTSLECFDSEINAQRMSTKLRNKKLVKNIGSSANDPRLYSMLKGEQSKTQREKLTEEKFMIMNKKYLQLLQASRHLFAISANLIKKYSQTEQGQSEESQQEIENHKKTLIQYRKLVFTESEDPKSECLTNKQIQDLLAKMKKNFQEKQKDDLQQNITELRNSALKCKYNQREQLISNLVQEDILDLENQTPSRPQSQNQSQQGDEDNDKVSNSQNQNAPKLSLTLQILRGYNHFAKTQMLAVISIILSTKSGQIYYEENDVDFQITNQIIKIYKDQEQGNVTSRFCLSIFNKLAFSKLLIIHFIDQDLHKLIFFLMKKCQTDKLHNFCSEYGSALLVNIFSDNDILNSYKQESVEGLEVIQQLIDCLHLDFSLSVNKNILLALSKFKTVDFNEQLLEVGYDEKINEFLQNVSSQWQNEFHKQEILTYHAQLFASQELKKPDFDEEDQENLRNVMDTQKQEEAQKNANDMQEKDIFIFFEHFTDEIDHQYTNNI